MQRRMSSTVRQMQTRPFASRSMRIRMDAMLDTAVCAVARSSGGGMGAPGAVLETGAVLSALVTLFLGEGTKIANRPPANPPCTAIGKSSCPLRPPSMKARGASAASCMNRRSSASLCPSKNGVRFRGVRLREFIAETRLWSVYNPNAHLCHRSGCAVIGPPHFVEAVGWRWSREEDCRGRKDVMLAELDRDKVVDLDFTSAEFRRNAHRHVADWARWPPFYVLGDGPPQVIVGRYAHVHEVFSDPERFASQLPRGPGYEQYDKFMGIEFMTQMDGERHARLRRLLMPAFSSRRMAQVEADIAGIVEGMLDDIERDGPAFDAMSQYGARLVVGALVTTMMGLDKTQQR